MTTSNRPVQEVAKCPYCDKPMSLYWHENVDDAIRCRERFQARCKANEKAAELRSLAGEAERAQGEISEVALLESLLNKRTKIIQRFMEAAKATDMETPDDVIARLAVSTPPVADEEKIDTSTLSALQCRQVLFAIERARTLGYNDGHAAGVKLSDSRVNASNFKELCGQIYRETELSEAAINEIAKFILKRERLATPPVASAPVCPICHAANACQHLIQGTSITGAALSPAQAAPPSDDLIWCCANGRYGMMHECVREAAAPAAAQVNFVQVLPGGECLAHGKYETGTQCPEWPDCLNAPCLNCGVVLLRHTCRFGSVVKDLAALVSKYHGCYCKDIAEIIRPCRHCEDIQFIEAAFTKERTEIMRPLLAQIDFCEREMNNFRRNARYAVEDIIAALNERVEKAERDRQQYKDSYRVSIGEVWHWQGDEDDHLESLTCPILIRPEQLREIMQNAVTVVGGPVPEKCPCESKSYETTSDPKHIKSCPSYRPERRKK